MACFGLVGSLKFSLVKFGLVNLFLLGLVENSGGFVLLCLVLFCSFSLFFDSNPFVSLASHRNCPTRAPSGHFINNDYVTVPWVERGIVYKGPTSLAITLL